MVSKRIKFILFSIAIIFSLFLTSCRYEMFFEEDNNKIGETEHFIISKDSMGEYYISGFTNKGLGSKVLTIPEYVNINEDIYYISYVDDIFKHHSYVRQLNISIPTDKININGCNSIRVVYLSQENLVNPDVFFKGLRNIDVYVVESTYTYQDEEFLKHNNVYYDVAPEVGNFDNLTIYEYISLGISAIGLIIAISVGYALIVFLKSESPNDHNQISAFLCVVGLGIYAIGTAILTYLGYEDLIYIKGSLFMLPVILAIACFIVKDEMVDDKIFKFFLISLIASGVVVIADLIASESITLILAELLAIFILALLVGLTKFFQTRIGIFFMVLSFALIFGTPVSVYLCDLLLNLIFGNLFLMIISGIIILAAIIIFIIILIKIIKNFVNRDDVYVESIPKPEFNGIFGCNISLPNGFRWEFKPTITYQGDSIIFFGKIVSEKVYSSEDEADKAWARCTEKMYESAKSIVHSHYNMYPNSQFYEYYDFKNVEFRYKIKRQYYK